MNSNLRDVGSIHSQTSESKRSRAANDPDVDLDDGVEIGGIPKHWMEKLGLESQPTGAGSGILLDLMLAHESPVMKFVEDFALEQFIKTSSVACKLENPTNRQLKDMYFWSQVPEVFLTIARIMAVRFDNNEK